MMIKSPIAERPHTWSANLHFTVLFSSVILFGMVLSRTLLFFGLTNLIVRSMLVLTSSYGFFFIAMKIWINKMKENRLSLEELALQSENAQDLKSDQARPKQKFNIFDFDPVSGLIEGEVVLLVILVLAMIFWICVEGPVIMIDAAFEVALAAGLMKASKEMTKENWHGKVIRRTIAPFLFIFVISIAAIAVRLDTCPGKTRVSELVTQCKQISP